jgi:dolichol-phosphate mannosyltransferase
LLKRFVKFSIVGLSGTVVNMVVYAVAIQMGMYYLGAAVVSFLFAVTNNFYWNFRWTFKGQAVYRSRRNKYFRFLAISLLNLGFNLLLLRLFVESLEWNKTLAQLVAIGLVSVLNFLLNSRFTFGEKAENGAAGPMNGEED